MIQNLVLDFDGTLVDPAPRDYRLYCDIMATLGQSVLPFEEYWPFRRDNLYLHFLLKKTWPDADWKRFVALRNEACELDGYVALDRCFDDTKLVLCQLIKRYDLHIISARMKPATLIDEVDRLGLSKWFTSVITSPGSKRAAIEKLGNVKAVVGDTEHDVVPALDLGVMAVAVTTGIRTRESLQRLGAHHVCDSLTEVLEFL